MCYAFEAATVKVGVLILILLTISAIEIRH